MGSPARKVQPAPTSPANDDVAVDPRLRPFVEALAELLVADLRRRPVR